MISFLVCTKLVFWIWLKFVCLADGMEKKGTEFGISDRYFFELIQICACMFIQLFVRLLLEVYT